MIRLSRQTDYGIVLLSHLASTDETRLNATALSQATLLPGPMVAKILKQLVHGGLLESHRGVNGGYSLAKAPADVTVAQIIAAIDGPIAITDCVEESTDECSYEATCRVRGNWLRINEAVREALDAITLEEMARVEPAPPGSLPDVLISLGR